MLPTHGVLPGGSNLRRIQRSLDNQILHRMKRVKLMILYRLVGVHALLMSPPYESFSTLRFCYNKTSEHCCKKLYRPYMLAE